MTEIMLGKILQTQAENAERARDDMRRELGRQLAAALDAKGATVEEINRRTGLSLGQLSRLLVGQRRPDDATLDAKGATVEEINRRTGLSLGQLSRLLVGQRRPDDATLEDLFALLAEYDLKIEIKEADNAEIHRCGNTERHHHRK